MDQCDACGQDILLWPEITPDDARLTYVRYCPRCDAGEPVVTPRQRVQAPDQLETGSAWFADAPSLRPVATMVSSPRPSVRQASPTDGADATGDGIDLWWDGRNRGGRQTSEDSVDAKWARFVAGSDEYDEDMASSEGSFAFGGEDVPRRRRARFLRRSA
jgi:hypothetical protein